ncbi:MAG: pyridoxal 5'-phosphate synthase glutaminase subunit PdxT [Fibrella sp.]|nr:pyridoxal 5'-phosphate synthase glutaminase subunit PdxT [Armatimonadota bacterium]
MNSQTAYRPRIGILALQGGYDVHVTATNAADGDAVEVRTPDEVAACDGLILPGGESTTIGRLMNRFGLDTAIHEAHDAGKPIFGTCAGMILLAKRIDGGEKRGGQPTLGLMDISVVRNAFGRQTESFETDLTVPDEVATGGRVRGVFIRAPHIVDAGTNVHILARFENKAVLAREGNLLAAAFHPELTEDTRLHQYFVRMVAGQKKT